MMAVDPVWYWFFGKLEYVMERREGREERRRVTHNSEAEDALSVVDSVSWSAEWDSPLLPELLVVCVGSSVVLRLNDRHSGWEVTRADDVDSDTQISPGELGRELLGEGDGRGFTAVVVELTPLRGLGDTAHGGEVDDVSRLGESTDRLGRAEEREERERGEVVRGGVDLEALEPSLKVLAVEHLLGDTLWGLLAGVDVGASGGDTVVCCQWGFRVNWWSNALLTRRLMNFSSFSMCSRNSGSQSGAPPPNHSDSLEIPSLVETSAWTAMIAAPDLLASRSAAFRGSARRPVM